MDKPENSVQEEASSTVQSMEIPTEETFPTEEQEETMTADEQETEESSSVASQWREHFIDSDWSLVQACLLPHDLLHVTVKLLLVYIDFNDKINHKKMYVSEFDHSISCSTIKMRR